MHPHRGSSLFMLPLLGLTVLGLALIPARAEAHAALVTATPAPSSTAAAPAMIELHFSETLEPKFSGFKVMENGAAIDVGDVTVEKDSKTLMATPSMPLPPGNYKMMWHAAANDAHKSKGDYSFTVQ